MTILKAEQIFKAYTDTGKRVDVLCGIDLEIAEGETVAIVGPSGAGKSTLMHILGGLDAPDKGRVFLGGKEIYTLSDAKRAALRNTETGFVFQFYHLLPELNALENVLLPLFIGQNRRTMDKAFMDQGRAALEEVGLAERALHKPNQLSGGEQQRVALARALMNNPRVLLCDEPTGNLDSKTGAAVMDLLLAINAKKARTLVIVTHDQSVAARCGRVIHMKDGTIISA